MEQSQREKEQSEFLNRPGSFSRADGTLVRPYKDVSQSEREQIWKEAFPKYQDHEPLTDLEKKVIHDHYKAGLTNPLTYEQYWAGYLTDDPVNRPAHYTAGSVEVIDMMERIWGVEAVKIFCELNAFKYRQRAGLKGDGAQDLAKAQWYEKHRKQISNPYRTISESVE